MPVFAVQRSLEARLTFCLLESGRWCFWQQEMSMNTAVLANGLGRRRLAVSGALWRPVPHWDDCETPPDLSQNSSSDFRVLRMHLGA